MPQLTDTCVTQPNTPDPNVVQGMHKCCLTKHLHENGDPLAHKRARNKAASSTVLTVSNLPTASTSLSTAASSNDRLDIQLIDIDDSDYEDFRKDDDNEGEATELDKSDNAELSKSPIATSDLIIYHLG
jgi:hypothetical protein